MDRINDQKSTQAAPQLVFIQSFYEIKTQSYTYYRVESYNAKLLPRDLPPVAIYLSGRRNGCENRYYRHSR